MRFIYSHNELDQVYSHILHSAEKRLKNGDISSALDLIRLAAETKYDVNDIYMDDRLEILMSDISKRLFKERQINPHGNKVIFYDYYGVSNRGLTQQYLDALFQIKDIEVCYVLETPRTHQTDDIIRMLESHSSRTYELIQSTNEAKINHFHDIIEIEKPSVIFYHIAPWSPIPYVASLPFRTIKKILINITDHAFGLGNGEFFDYVFEFREYGCKISLEKRKFELKQIKLLPYYPWQEKKIFQGFPVDITNKVVLFSGAYMPKIEDSNNTFFNIVMQILRENDNALMFFAGSGDSRKIYKLICDNNLQNRFYLLGNRCDINEVFKNIDIYIGTYPVGGGLMSQYACVNGKPILAYKTYEIEKIVCNRKWLSFVFDTVEDLVHEANHLISDKNYRKMRGLLFKSLTTDQKDFRINFSKEYMNLKSKNTISFNETVDYDSVCRRSINNINTRNNVGWEIKILKKCPFALNWKMMINIFMNLKIIRRI